MRVLLVDGREIQALLGRYDRAIDGLETDAIARIQSAFDSAFRGLEQELRTAYPELQAVGSLVVAQRKVLILDRLGSFLNLVNPSQAENYQRLLEELLQLSSATGGDLAGQLIQAYESTELQTFSGIPVEAIANQAAEGMRRLSRYSEDFRDRASIIIGMGLTQGWGAGRVATALRNELGLAKGKAETLARTEVLSALNQSAIARYQQNGIEYVQWAASPSEVCPFCVARNQQVFKASEIVFPPHPRCRCFLVCWSPFWQAKGLTDDQFAEEYRQQGIAELAAQGQRPNSGLAPFEKSAGLERPPQAAWTPGDAPLTPAPAPEPEPEPQPRRRAPKKPREFPLKRGLKKLEVVRSLGGSTGAELVRDPETEKLFVRKRGSSSEHLREEFAADQAYRAMGVNVPNAKLYETDDGPVKLAEFIQGRPLSDLNSRERQQAYEQLKQNYAADALLGNWDVVGLSQDNILVDAEGTAWRIDNGGSLRFRAQGGLKRGDQWNDYPTELWSLRDEGVNEQTTRVFGDLGHFEIVEQIEQLSRRRKSLLKAAPEDVRPTLKRRLDEMQRLARVSRTLEADQWKAEYISRFTKHSLGIRNAGMVDKLPERLDLAANNQLYDENNKLFDGLRDPDGVFGDIIRYINNSGGNYEIIDNWADAQAEDSWSDLPRAMKWEIAQSRNLPTDTYYWSEGEDDARSLHERFNKSYGEQAFQESLAAFHAWNYEQLQKMDMPNNDRKAGTFQVIRTESKKVVREINGFNPGQKKLTMQRGAAESTSMFSRVTVYGSEITVQEVPHHRVLGMYMQSRNTDTVGRGLFAGDSENELVALLEGIKFDYLKPEQWRDAEPNYKPG
ncbi:MAG: minor capsid protein [Cyanobacteria bacterium J06639_14]